MLIVAKPPSSVLLNPSSCPRFALYLALESRCCFLSTSPSKLRPLKFSSNLASVSVLVPPTVQCPSRENGRKHAVVALCTSHETASEDPDPPPSSSDSSDMSSDSLQNGNGSVNGEVEELELRGKPFPKPVQCEIDVAPEPQKPDKDEALAPFLKFFKPRESEAEGEEDSEQQSGRKEENAESGGEMGRVESERESNKVIEVEYYEPKPGDFVVGVVVYGNESKLDVNVGADMLGTMLTKEVLPLYDKEMDYLLCDLDKDAEEFMNNGKMGLIQYEDAFRHKPVAGRPVVEAGTVLFAEVLGRTLSGRPLLSSRRFFRRIAWHRVRQIQRLNEPIQVRVTEWNTGGLLTRIEGLRAFLPKAELTTRVNNFAELKANVGRQMYVHITRINEETNDLIISEKEAWENVYLREGTLFEGSVVKIYSYGAQIRLGQSSRSGLLHMSNISRGKVKSASDLLSVDEKVKVLVVKSLLPNRISLSIAELESEPGLFISDKQRVFAEAEEMAKKYRQKMPPKSAAAQKPQPPPEDDTPILYQDESSLYANWKWFKFQRED